MNRFLLETFFARGDDRPHSLPCQRWLKCYYQAITLIVGTSPLFERITSNSGTIALQGRAYRGHTCARPSAVRTSTFLRISGLKHLEFITTLSIYCAGRAVT